MLLQAANISAVEATNSKDLPEHRRAARALQAANRFFSRVYHRLEVLTPSRLPETGAAILICNHTSPLDPQLIQSVCPRLITWMMAAEYYDIWGIRQIFRTVGVIPVTRSGRDTSATRAAMRALHNGQILGVFPEGKIETTDELLPFQTGVAMMAMKTGVPVYPAYLDGTQRGMEMVPALLRRQESTIAFGPAIAFDRSQDGKEGLEQAIRAMTRAVEALRQFTRNARSQQRL
jgi:1-acyl-sn-glycerol-3-phosphate acyltransferase